MADRVRGALLFHLRAETSIIITTLRSAIGLTVVCSQLDCHEHGRKEQLASSNYAIQENFLLGDIVRLRRGETPDDCRPNTGFNPTLLAQLLPGHAFVNLLVSIARQGILQIWTAPEPTARRSPQNHKSAQQYLPALLKSIRQGQADGTYLNVDVKMLEHWDNIQCSPFGAVEKKRIDHHIEIRPTQDLSYPVDTSTNDRLYTDCAPDIIYAGVVILVRRIETAARNNPGTVIKLLNRDVKTAFCHLKVHAEHVRRMGAPIPEENALVIDLAAPFGWRSSPAFYGAFGELSQRSSVQIHQLLFPTGRTKNPFFISNGLTTTFWLNPIPLTD